MNDRKYAFTVTLTVNSNVEASDETMRRSLEQVIRNWALGRNGDAFCAIAVHKAAERPEAPTAPSTTPSAPKGVSDAVMAPWYALGQMPADTEPQEALRPPGHIPPGTQIWEALRLLSSDLATLRGETREDLQRLDQRLAALEAGE